MPNVNEQLEKFSAEATSNLEYLISTGSMLSTESKSLPFTGSIGAAFRGFVDSVTTFINGLKIGNYAKQNIDTDDLHKRLQLTDYSKTRLFHVTVPAGFTGRWVPFLDFVLKDIMPQVSALEQTMTVVNTKLAIALNEPDRLKAQSGIRDLAHKIALVDLADFEKLKAYFGQGAKTQVSLSSVIDRNADISEAYALVNRLNGELGAVDFVKVQKLVSRLAELTQSLNETLSKEEHTEMSGMVTSQLSDLFYQLGVTLTSGAVLMDVTKQLTDSMISSRDDLIQQMS